MKKRSAILISASVLFTLTACDSSNDKTNSQSNPQSNTVDGVYFNAETEQVLLIDSQSETAPVISHNYLSISSPMQIVFANTLNDKSNSLVMGSDILVTPRPQVENGRTSLVATLNGSDSVIFDVSNLDSINALNFTRQPRLDFNQLIIDADDGTNTQWTINSDHSYSVKLGAYFGDNCLFHGTLSDTGRSYWIDKNSLLNTECKPDQDKLLANSSYTTRVYAVENNGQYYVSASMINNEQPNTTRPIWGGVQLSK